MKSHPELHYRFTLLGFTLIGALLASGAALWLAKQAQASISMPSERTGPPAAPILRSPPAALSVQITDRETGFSVPGASIHVPELGVTAVSDEHGQAAWQLELTDSPQAITVTVSAFGYGEWQMINISLLAGEVVTLTPHLRAEPVHYTLPGPGENRQVVLSAQEVRSFDAFLRSLPENWQPPDTIRVGITGDWVCNPDITYTVETVDFEFYVKHVLPNEWESGEGWRDEAYRAGAMAVKMYAWYWISLGGKWSDADVLDSTCDQVYNPEISRSWSDRAVEYTWHWRLASIDGSFFPAYHKHDETYGCTPGVCMSQVGTRDLANQGYTWDEIVFYYYSLRNPVLAYQYDFPAGFALRFNGTAGDFKENRLLIPVGGDPSPPVDVGAEDFTIEWWMKTAASELVTGGVTVTCGATQDWIYGNILLDRHIPGQGNGYGVSLEAGRLLFGVTGETVTDSLTLCGSLPLSDTQWHHVAVQRRAADGYLWVYVDGQLDAASNGPGGDISYPDAYSPTHPTDPFLAVGAWKLDDDHLLHPFYRGWLDEIRFSNILRYTSPFTLPATVFVSDTFTVALYHLDEGISNVIHDSSGISGGPSDGLRLYGGDLNGPEWWPSTLFFDILTINLPLLLRAVP